MVNARSPQQLLEHLIESLEFLRVSCKAFDEGIEAEAKRLAVTLRVLFHDHADSSHSLLRQMSLKNKFAYYDSAEQINPANLLSTPGLAVLYPTNPSAPGPFYAPLNDLPPIRLNKRVGFEAWWKTPVTREMDGATWSREQFVKMLANKEGGAHVQPTVAQTYDRLIEENGMSIDFFDSTGATLEASNNLALVSVRQIAHEVLKTAQQPAWVYPQAT